MEIVSLCLRRFIYQIIVSMAAPTVQYHMKNKHIARKKLTQDEIRKEVIALQDMGHKRLALEAGEDPVHNTMDIIWNVLRLSIALSIRMVLSVVSISILRQQLLTTTAC